MCALECQKVSRPSSLSKVNNLSPQSPSSALDMSHKTPFTWEINALEAKPFDISLAISKGVVSHFFPSFTVPSGKVILRHINIKNQPTIPKKKKKHIYLLIETEKGITLWGHRKWIGGERFVEIWWTRRGLCAWEWRNWDIRHPSGESGRASILHQVRLPWDRRRW